jgi:hypothetical protein
MYSPERQAKDFATSLVNADNTPPINPGYRLAQYLEALDSKSLLLSKSGQAKGGVKRFVAKVLPLRAKQAIRRAVRH